MPRGSMSRSRRSTRREGAHADSSRPGGGARRKNPGHARRDCLLDGRTLETIPIMEYVWKRTNGVLVNEEPLRGRE